MIASRQDIYGEKNIEFILIPLQMFSDKLGRKIDLIELRTIINYIMLAYDEGFPIGDNIENINWDKLLNDVIPKLWGRSDNGKQTLKQMIKDTKRIGKVNVYRKYKKYLK